jgi:hypothetical protein
MEQLQIKHLPNPPAEQRVRCGSSAARPNR